MSQHLVVSPNNTYCRNLNLGFELDTSVLDWLQDQCHDPTTRSQYNINHATDNRLREFLHHRGLYITLAEAFYTPANGTLPTHADGGTIDNHCKLNFVYGAQGSTMRWWQPKANASGRLGQTPIQTTYIFFDEQDCDLVHEAYISTPSLVNVGQIHSVSNPTNEGRWCLSFVLKFADTKAFPQWNQAVEIFNDFLI